MEVIILGCGSAIPTAERNPSGQLLAFPDASYLIDCAEGTQIRIIQEKARTKFLKAIFISHLHGDHYLGLMGLLWSLDLAGRTKPLTLVSPKGLSEIMEVQLRHANSSLSFPLIHLELEPETSESVFLDENISVRAFPLKHGVPCFGFRFNEHPKRRKFRKDAIDRYRLSPEQIRKALNGEQLLKRNGDVIENNDLFHPEAKLRSYSYCTDTLPADFALKEINESSLLYHEATYDSSKQEIAKKRFHSTAQEAAQVAKAAKVGQLVIGHYSSRYKKVDLLLKEAKTEFENTICAHDGLIIPINLEVLKLQ
ncbi:MAG: ribonuclease Z [Granulosicoccus sp.]|jgi:ribonuclease Z